MEKGKGSEYFLNSLYMVAGIFLRSRLDACRNCSITDYILASYMKLKTCIFGACLLLISNKISDIQKIQYIDTDIP